MIQQCQHCGTRYSESDTPGNFCCAGCEHVHQLIQGGGLGEYYSQQDRVGRPVGDRPFAESDLEAVRQLQRRLEGAAESQMTFDIRGMSCLGCAWLIEQLCRRHPGVISAKVALDSNWLSLRWRPGAFDLGSLAGDLQSFGYRIGADVGSAGYAVSPLAARFALSFVFSMNGLLLSAAAGAGIGGEGLRQLYKLLVALCLFFTLFIGAAVFLKPVWGGLQLRRVHSDIVPALLALALFVIALGSLLFSGRWIPPAVLYFTVLPAFLFARWSSQNWRLRAGRGTKPL